MIYKQKFIITLRCPRPAAIRSICMHPFVGVALALHMSRNHATVMHNATLPMFIPFIVHGNPPI